MYVHIIKHLKGRRDRHFVLPSVDHFLKLPEYREQLLSM